MKRLLWILTTLVLLASSCSSPEKVKFVTVQGTELIAPDGSVLFIKGTNLGNWLNPEGYMFNFRRTNSGRLINQMLCEMVGPDSVAEWWQLFKDNYVTIEDFEFLKSIGCNTIRIPFHYKLFTNEDYMGLNDPDEGFRRIDQAVEWARQTGMYLILDMHDAPGGQTGDNIDDSYGYPWLFESEKSQELFISIWRRIASHYVNEPTVLGYELCNEPIAPYFEDNLNELNASLQPLYIRATEAIREVDRNHIVIIGAPQWNTNFEPMTDWTFDDNIMYTCHRYGGEAGVDGIKDYIEFRDKTGLPMYMGEIGHNTWEWQSTYSRVMQDNGIGYTFWPYKKLTHECVNAFAEPENWDKVVEFSECDRSDFFKIRANRPNQEEMRKALLDLIENIKFKNCTPIVDYIESMNL